MALARGVAYKLTVPFPDTGLTITPTVRIDGGDFAAADNACTEIGTTKVYEITVSADEMDSAKSTDVLLTPDTGDAILATLVTDPAAVDVSALALEATAQSILTDTNELQTNQGNWLTATGFSTHSAADVWAVSVRSLTTFGTLVADIWAYATRTLSAFAFTPTPSNAADTTAIKAKTDNLPTDPADQSAVETAITSATTGLATATNVTDAVTSIKGAGGKTHDDLSDEIAALDVSTDLGPDECTLVLSSVLGDELEGAVVYVTSDLAGTIKSPVRVTDDTGRVAFNLVDGDTYYVWITASGYTGTNPTSFVASAD